MLISLEITKIKEKIKESKKRYYCLVAFKVKSDGFIDTPHLLHLPLKGLILSFMDFKFIILFRVEPHFSQTISIHG